MFGAPFENAARLPGQVRLVRLTIGQTLASRAFDGKVCPFTSETPSAERFGYLAVKRSGVNAQPWSLSHLYESFISEPAFPH